MSGSNKYPIYVISKGRHDKCLTADFLLKDGVDFKLIIEPQEYDLYRLKYPKNIIYKLPFSNLGLGSYPARNWCWDDSIEKGFEKHWILDDNIRGVLRLYKGVRINANSIYGFKFVEDLTANYKNVALSGMNYAMFTIPTKHINTVVVNHHLYSNLLIRNDIPQRWRLRYNEDTDLNLQVLKAGMCIISVRTFMVEKMRTMTMKGGNTDELYKDNGRLKMARLLEKAHPDVVSVKWRFGRPQHVVNWGKFKHNLIPADDIKKIDMNNYGTLKAVNKVKNPTLKTLVENYGRN